MEKTSYLTIEYVLLVLCCWFIISDAGFAKSKDFNEIRSQTPTSKPNRENGVELSAPAASKEQVLNFDESQPVQRTFKEFNEKMELYSTYFSNEMISVTKALNNLKEKLHTLEVVQHEIGELLDHRNVIDQKLHLIQESLASQSTSSRLDRLENSVNHIRSRVDEIVAKRHGSSKTILSKREDNENISENSGEEAVNCESKIDHLITFIHSFAEINRVESGDILSRLGNMQSQLIQFFDANEAIAKPPTQTTQNENKIDESVDVFFVGNSTNFEIFSVNSNSTDENVFENATTMPLQRLRRVPKIQRSARDISRRKSMDFQYPIQCNQMLHYCNEYVNRVGNVKNPKNDVELDYNADTNRRNIQKNANYDQPSPVGCHQFVNVSRADGIYQFEEIPTYRTSNGRAFNERLCSFDIDGVAWTVVQSRGPPSSKLPPENFNRTWNDYKNGFGSLNGEFWFGNDFIHRLTYDDDMELKIVLESWDNQRMEFEYEVFRVDSEENQYNLFVDGYRGADKRMDAFAYHHNQDFSTFDVQHDKSGINDQNGCCSCAKSYSSGWWFNNCIEANLNGVYRLSPRNNNYVGIVWEKWLGDYSLKATKMMIRPKVEWPTRSTDGDNDSSNSKPPDDP